MVTVTVSIVFMLARNDSLDGEFGFFAQPIEVIKVRRQTISVSTDTANTAFEC